MFEVQDLSWAQTKFSKLSIRIILTSDSPTFSTHKDIVEMSKYISWKVVFIFYFPIWIYSTQTQI